MVNASGDDGLASLLFPTPIGGERRSKTGLNFIGSTGLGGLTPDFFAPDPHVAGNGDQHHQQRSVFAPPSRPQEAWECTGES